MTMYFMARLSGVSDYSSATSSGFITLYLNQTKHSGKTSRYLTGYTTQNIAARQGETLPSVVKRNIAAAQCQCVTGRGGTGLSGKII